uniref:Uncharacterized protein n=1 Tax=Romanomermis culicivorax TaxID=13658 RepID=A0A915HGJ8_ROMCU
YEIAKIFGKIKKRKTIAQIPSGSAAAKAKHWFLFHQSMKSMTNLASDLKKRDDDDEIGTIFN